MYLPQHSVLQPEEIAFKALQFLVEAAHYQFGNVNAGQRGGKKVLEAFFLNHWEVHLKSAMDFNLVRGQNPEYSPLLLAIETHIKRINNTHKKSWYTSIPFSFSPNLMHIHNRFRRITATSRNHRPGDILCTKRSMHARCIFCVHVLPKNLFSRVCTWPSVIQNREKKFRTTHRRSISSTERWNAR